LTVKRPFPAGTPVFCQSTGQKVRGIVLGHRVTLTPKVLGGDNVVGFIRSYDYVIASRDLRHVIQISGEWVFATDD